jgi:ABC-type antimicrobial peptide transport system permease subunit
MSVALMLLLLVIAMVAGLYPAFYSTRFQAAAILKGSLKLKNSNWFTRSLLSLQFALSIALLIGGFVAVNNAKFLQKLDMGYDVHQLISLDNLEPQEVQLLLDEIRRNPKIESASALRGSAIWGSSSDKVKVDTSTLDTRIYQVDANYIQTVGMEISEGRDFNEQMVSDFSEAVLVNRTFVEEAGWEQALNQRILYQDTARYVIGVVENIVNGFYENEQQAAIFTQAQPDQFSRIVLRADADALTTLNDEMRGMWKDLIPFKPYSASYITETAMYYPLREMRVMKKVYFFLALLGGLLATAGIFSLAQISVARRNKEIGVRKVLGASVKTIVNTVNREFVRILAVAAVLGCTIGYLFSEKILSGVYAFHVNIGAWPLILSGGIIVGIALLTTSLTIFRSASTNPVNVLRDE